MESFQDEERRTRAKAAKALNVAADLFRAPIAFIASARSGSAGEAPDVIALCGEAADGDRLRPVLDHLSPDWPTVLTEPADFEAIGAAASATRDIRFFAAVPMPAPETRGTRWFGIADIVTRRTISQRQIEALTDLGHLAADEIDVPELSGSQVDKFVDHSSLAFVTVDDAGKIRFANEAFAKLLGYDRRELLGAPVDIIVPERMKSAHHAGLARVVSGKASKLVGKGVEVSAVRRDGTEFPIELLLSVWPDGNSIGFGAVIRDISERRTREVRLLRLARNDTLTGLCNHHYFRELVEARLEDGEAATVLYLDLDGFRDLTDVLGHTTGDYLLQAVAIRLPSLLDENAIVARAGEDRFAILLAGVGDVLVADEVATRILTAFQTPFEIDHCAYQLGVRIGCAIAPAHGEKADELLASADFALHHAHQNDTRPFRLFERSMCLAADTRRRVQDELRRALRDGELEMYFQPQIAFSDGAVIGAEALIRWNHPERGLLGPSAILPALEDSALSLSIGWWTLDEACRKAAHWRDLGFDAIHVGVNLFRSQYLSGALPQRVTAALRRYDIPAHMLELEVTETITLHDDERSLAVARDLRNLGVRIALDDFGTGFASLRTLKNFPLTTLKIDRGFVQDLPTSKQSAAIVHSMLAMSRDLGFVTVAEGVETREQEGILRDFGCQTAQGYLYGRPMQAAALTELLERNNASPLRAFA